MTTDIFTYTYDTDPEISNPAKGNYNIHSGIRLTDDNFAISLKFKMVSSNGGAFGDYTVFGIMPSSGLFSPWKMCFSVWDDDEYIPGNTKAYIGAYAGGTYFGFTDQITDTNWHDIRLEKINNTASFYYDDILKGTTSTSGYYFSGSCFKLWGDNAAQATYPVAEWDSTQKNMHFCLLRSDTSKYSSYRWSGLNIYNPLTEYNYGEDLELYPNSLNIVKCNCSRWDVQDYSVIMETWLKKDALKVLMDNIKPGAVGELYKIIDKPVYYDKTWEGGNTLVLIPSGSSTSNLKNMRSQTVIYPKNITSTPVQGASGWLNVKIEGYISGSTI